jgi:hypothetical protein
MLYSIKVFITLPGKYWLRDVRYSNSDTILTLYRGTRYHLKGQRLASKKPEYAKELFNLRHALLRNVIERMFGVVKRRYQILRTASEYSLNTQTRDSIEETKVLCALLTVLRVSSF